RRRCRAARRPAHDPGRELRPGDRTPRTRVAGLCSADERARRPGEGHRGDTDPGPSARGQWALVLARHPGSPGPRGTRVPPGKLLRLQRGPADRDRPPRRGHTRARPEEVNVGLKRGPGIVSGAWADAPRPAALLWRPTASGPRRSAPGPSTGRSTTLFSIPPSAILRSGQAATSWIGSSRRPRPTCSTAGASGSSPAPDKGPTRFGSG